MAGIPNLSDILSQFSPVKPGPPRQSAGPEEKEPEFTDRYARIRSDSHGATFERAIVGIPTIEDLEREHRRCLGGGSRAGADRTSPAASFERSGAEKL